MVVSTEISLMGHDTSPATTTTNVAATATPATALAPGFGFHPTDEELVRYYLTRKVCGKSFKVDAIAEADIYKSEPWDLPGQSRLKGRDMEWYFFGILDKKYGNGSRMNRATGKGYWKATGNDRAVRHDSRTIGMKKTLVFHKGRAPGGKRTNWVMHEYRLVDEELERAGVVQDGFVVCKVFQKSGLGPPNGNQYAPFVEDEWNDDSSVLVPGSEGGEAADDALAGDDPHIEGDGPHQKKLGKKGMKGGRKNLKRATEEENLTIGEGQSIMQVVSLRGSNLIEVMDAEGEKLLALFPAKFQKSIWIKRGNFVVVDTSGREKALESGSKVACMVSQVLFYEQIRKLQKFPEWPEIFKTKILDESTGNLHSQSSLQEKDECDPSDDGLPPIEANINRMKPVELQSEPESDSDTDS